MEKKRLFQIKIALDEIKPEIWRRFLVEDSVTFEEFHDIIQTIMSWDDCHMYEFNLNNISIVSEENGHNLAESSFQLMKSTEFTKMLEENVNKGIRGIDINKVNKILEKQKKQKPTHPYDMNTSISELINFENQIFFYIYDFGDGWKHNLVIEKIFTDSQEETPLCIDGERACPPENCRGVYGYEKLMEIRKNKNHPLYKERILVWLGEEYDPERFGMGQINSMLKLEHGGSCFIPLGKLLKENNNEIMKLKTIFGKENYYAPYFVEIEYKIALDFIENKELKDKDVENAIKNIKENYLQDIDFFETQLEKDIMNDLSVALQDNKITHHELIMVLNYILWSIDNRTWMDDKQAYVKWSAYFLGIFDEKQKQNYEKYIRKFCQKNGVPKKDIDAIFNLGDAKLSEEEMKSSELECQFFNLEDSEKLDFVIENGVHNPFLLSDYLGELESKEDFKTIEVLFKKMIEVSDSFPLFEFQLGMNYLCMGNKDLGTYHIKNAIQNFENDEFEGLDEYQKKELLTEMKKELEKI